jgi:hypothetical protein
MTNSHIERDRWENDPSYRVPGETELINGEDFIALTSIDHHAQVNDDGVEWVMSFRNPLDEDEWTPENVQALYVYLAKTYRGFFCDMSHLGIPGYGMDWVSAFFGVAYRDGEGTSAALGRAMEETGFETFANDFGMFYNGEDGARSRLGLPARTRP